MQTRLPACVITKGKRSSTCGEAPAIGDGRTLGFSTVLGFGVAASLAASPVFMSFSSVGSGVTGTGGSTVGRNFSSLGANFAASSSFGNSIATKTIGTSVRTAQLANISRDDPNASEFFFKKLTMALNWGPGSASFTIGSTISPAPPLLNSWPTFRISP